MVMSGRSVNLTTLFLGRLRPPKRLISAPCTYYRQSLTTDLHESAEGERKVCRRTRVSNLELLALELNALPTALRGPAAGPLGCKYFLSVFQQHFQYWLCFVLDLAFETLRLFELVTFITDEPGISPVYCQTGRFPNKAQINDILLFFKVLQ